MKSYKNMFFTVTLFASVFIFNSYVLASDVLRVFVTIVPQKYFVKKIGGNLVDISVMIKPGANPATYEPKPKQMVALSQTAIYFAIGVPSEKAWLKKIISINPKITICYTDKGIDKLVMTKNAHGEHDTDIVKDPHIWLSPPHVKIQAKNIINALIAKDPAHYYVYKKNYNDFIKEIEGIDKQLKELFKSKGNKIRFMVFHPSWGYFAKTYSLQQIPIEIEGKSPKLAYLNKLIRFAKKEKVKAIFVQPQFSTTNAEIIAKEINAQIIFADPLAYDWKANLLDVGKKFNKSLR